VRARGVDVAREQVGRNGVGGGAPPELVLEELERSWNESRVGTRVVIGIEDVAFHQEVQDFVGRDSRFEIVAAAVDAERVRQVVAERHPDVTVACPSVASDLRQTAALEVIEPLVVVAEQMTVAVLRTAIHAGAHAVFAWPEEREEFLGTLASVRVRRPNQDAGRGRVIAVHGARGGAGVTFLATNLAASLAGQGLRTALVDLDVRFSDVSAALGIGPADGARTVMDLVPVMDELSPDHLDDAMFHHPRGFSVLLAPPEAADADILQPGLYRGAIALMAATNDVVVLHQPRAVDRLARTGFGLADRVLLVTTLDLFSLYGAKRTMSLLGREVPSTRWQVVLNKPMKSALNESDVERVLGLRPAVTVRFDARVRRSQERGELLPERAGGIGKDVRRLAALLGAEPAREGARRERA
jgi:Flp pilus assembly CpaE family ATPase